jgi:hypothetical protein
VPKKGAGEPRAHLAWDRDLLRFHGSANPPNAAATTKIRDANCHSASAENDNKIEAAKAGTRVLPFTLIAAFANLTLSLRATKGR